jgi:hypothetical protein
MGFMRRRTFVELLVLLAVLVLVIAFIPTQSANVTGVASNPGGPNYHFHYERSLICEVFPVGLSYWNHALILGCNGPPIP